MPSCQFTACIAMFDSPPRCVHQQITRPAGAGQAPSAKEAPLISRKDWLLRKTDAFSYGLLLGGSVAIPATHFTGIALNCFTQPVMAISVGSRSMLLAPKKPTIPLQVLRMYAASS